MKKQTFALIPELEIKMQSCSQDDYSGNCYLESRLVVLVCCPDRGLSVSGCGSEAEAWAAECSAASLAPVEESKEHPRVLAQELYEETLY